MFGLLDVSEECVALDAKCVEGHLVEASASSRVVAVKLAGSVERSFLPEARKVKHAEGTCYSGSDEWNDLAHCFGIVLVSINRKPRDLGAVSVVSQRCVVWQILIRRKFPTSACFFNSDGVFS